MPVALAVVFADDVTRVLNLLVTIALVAIEGYALINCLTQRADAFPVVGSLSKNAWLGILLAALLVTATCGFIFRDTISIFSFAAITAAAIYVLDVRPALRDATNGPGGW